MTTIVNGATKARLLWIAAQLEALENWIRPDGETILSGAKIELQDIINNATEPATVAPTTDIQAMTADQVGEVVKQVTDAIASTRADVLASIAAIPAPAAPAPAAATTTAPADATQAPAA
jgi:hypothetical protein